MTRPLITPAQLAALEPAPAILDVRWHPPAHADLSAYLEGHIPGAVFIDLDRQLSDPPSDRGRHPLPGPVRFTEAMQAAGVSSARAVVVYDAATSMAAARAWWLLRHFGHPQVMVLDGGLAAWIAAGNLLSTEEPGPQRGDFVARPGGMPVVSAADVTAAGVLIDARAPERFSGADEPIDPVAGHIPGARNRPTSENVEPAGSFLPPPALRAAFEQLGVRDGVQVTAYCGSGVTASHEVLALELAGYNAALYPGSWSEWITNPERPVAASSESSGE